LVDFPFLEVFPEPFEDVLEVEGGEGVLAAAEELKHTF
jgi:hypothetical protein